MTPILLFLFGLTLIFVGLAAAGVWTFVLPFILGLPPAAGNFKTLLIAGGAAGAGAGVSSSSMSQAHTAPKSSAARTSRCLIPTIDEMVSWLAMKLIVFVLALLCMVPASQAADSACPTNSHGGSFGCECNNGYAKSKDGKCVLKRAKFDDDKAAAKSAKPKADKTDKTP